MVDVQLDSQKAYGEAIAVIMSHRNDEHFATPEIQAQFSAIGKVLEDTRSNTEAQGNAARMQDAQMQVQAAISRLQSAMAQFGANPPADLARALQTAQSYANISDPALIAGAFDAARNGEQVAAGEAGQKWLESAGEALGVLGSVAVLGTPALADALVNTGRSVVNGVDDLLHNPQAVKKLGAGIMKEIGELGKYLNFGGQQTVANGSDGQTVAPVNIIELQGIGKIYR